MIEKYFNTDKNIQSNILKSDLISF